MEKHQLVNSRFDVVERARNAGKPAVLELLTDPLQITPAMRVTEMPT